MDGFGGVVDGEVRGPGHFLDGFWEEEAVGSGV